MRKGSGYLAEVLALLPTADCVPWPGYRDAEGYGETERTTAHRVVYLATGGEIPEGYQLDHLCRNRACVNPVHLEPVTPAENTRRGGPATKTVCVNGHPYTPANTYVTPSGRRDCRTCIRDRVRRYSTKARAS